MKKVCVAPGEKGQFKNWGEETYLEERCFPELFPFGNGGYLSSGIEDPERALGFAEYCVGQLMSCDPKFRMNISYIFFLLLVKELIHMKRCVSTVLRQATRLPTLNKQNLSNINNEDLTRYNRSYRVFQNLRGTAPYYEKSKMNLMALIRQLGCPTIFLTLSCAEYDWFELLKEIAETVYRREFSNEEIEEMTVTEKNKLISENVVQSTLHYNKRFQKLFTLMRSNFFKSDDNSYHVSSYFFRVEFQQRGAPHVHALLWLKDKNNEDAPTYWSKKGDEDWKLKHNQIEKFADMLTSTSTNFLRCQLHLKEELTSCPQCADLKEKVKKYQTHSHRGTCEKKGKFMTVKKHEGHGWLDGITSGDELKKVPLCRFRYPLFPMDVTTLVVGLTRETDENVVTSRKKDLRKLVTFLIRQTKDAESFLKIKDISFNNFLYIAGMFDEYKSFDEYTVEDNLKARTRYLNALSASIIGSAKVFLKRNVDDIFINGFNSRIMELFRANHDLQICVDPYAAGQYVSKYITKNEAGTSRLMKAIEEEALNLGQIEKLYALASALDKSREISIQEAIYRLMGLQITKSSVKVKFLSTVHPHQRDGLLKGNIEELDEGESVFHMSPHQYYEVRPFESVEQDQINYKEEELQDNYWENICLAEFWSKYEVVYGKVKKSDKNRKTNIIPLVDKKGFIRRRSEMAVLRYYLNYSNDEDLARGLLILFLPFRHEMTDIHEKDVKIVLEESRDLVEGKRLIFEKYKNMTDLISSIKSDDAKNEEIINDEEDEADEIETTSSIQIENFNKWARSQASKDLSEFKSLTSVCDLIDLRTRIVSLNGQQRLLFDDVVERIASTDIEEKPFYLFLSGNAGTGKSYLLRLLIDAVKVVKLKSGDDLTKPPLITLAPTANAAFIIGGKTIDSALGFLPVDQNKYSKASEGKMATMRHNFEDVSIMFLDEVSMVGASKLLKINYRLQDLTYGERSKMYMGGISCVASGIFLLHILTFSIKYFVFR